MPDYDSKNIPVLDDIIEHDGEEKAAAHDKIIVTDEMHADDNTLDLFNETTDIEIDNAEPEIGTIDQFINEDIEIDIEAIAAPENKTLDDEVPEAPNDLAAGSDEASSISEPAINLDLDVIIDDVVTQLLPEMEQQLRTRLKQALQKSLPQEVIEPEKSNP